MAFLDRRAEDPWEALSALVAGLWRARARAERPVDGTVLAGRPAGDTAVVLPAERLGGGSLAPPPRLDAARNATDDGG